MSNKIISQGCYDSACFPYSLMNGYKSLVKPKSDNFDFLESIPLWISLIKIYPQPSSLISGEYFFDHFLKQDMKNVDAFLDSQFDNIIDSAINIFKSNNSKITYKKIELNEIANFDFTNSVIVILLENPVKTECGNILQNHYLCINGKDDKFYNTACSFTIHSINYSNYYEKEDELTKRYYNNRIKIEDINDANIGAGKSVLYSMTLKK